MIAYYGCNKCAYVAESAQGRHCGRCVHNCTEQFKRATNADRIRSMTDEELAKELVKHHIDDGINFCQNLKECEEIFDKDEEIPIEKCEECLLNWLQSESEV